MISTELALPFAYMEFFLIMSIDPLDFQCGLNSNMEEVVKNEILKLLDAKFIYSIVDSDWVSPMQVVPKKNVKSEQEELISTTTITPWRMCIDYRKLNDDTWKDHFPLLP